jgi:AcrR family transcriptional regulator
MDDLADELGMSKKTLYAHFASKTALVEAMVLDKLARADAEFAEILSRHRDDFCTALHELLAALQRHTGEIQPAFLRDIQREAPEIFALVQTRRQAIIERHFGRLLADGRKSGLVRRDVPTRFIIDILLSAVQGIVNPVKLAELNLTPKPAVAAILKVILEGALTPDGREKL